MPATLLTLIAFAIVVMALMFAMMRRAPPLDGRQKYSESARDETDGGNSTVSVDDVLGGIDADGGHH